MAHSRWGDCDALFWHPCGLNHNRLCIVAQGIILNNLRLMQSFNRNKGYVPEILQASQMNAK